MNITSHLNEDLLNAWIDDALTDDERRVVSHHLSSCEDCTEELNALQLVKSLLGDLPEPALPRSFQLTREQTERLQPPRTSQATPLSIRALPIVRALSIAAIFAVLVLGAATALGPVTSSFMKDGADFTAHSETDRAANASEESYPPPMSLIPGEVVDQGDSASSGNSAMEAPSRSGEPSTPVEEDQETFLKTATVTAGIFALLATVLWLALRQATRSTSVNR